MRLRRIGKGARYAPPLHPPGSSANYGSGATARGKSSDSSGGQGAIAAFVSQREMQDDLNGGYVAQVRGSAMIKPMRFSTHASRAAGLRALLAVCSLITLSTPSLSQGGSDTQLDAALVQLVGTSARTWVLERVVMSMGTHGTCTAGETYRFETGGKLVITRCKDQVLSTEDTSWTLNRTGPIDLALSFDGKGYFLTFGGSSRSPEMRWSYMHGSKIDPTVTTSLSLSKD